jgi:hypothetical protein
MRLQALIERFTLLLLWLAAIVGILGVWLITWLVL